jgi:hypothetical protein
MTMTLVNTHRLTPPTSPNISPGILSLAQLLQSIIDAAPEGEARGDTTRPSSYDQANPERLSYLSARLAIIGNVRARQSDVVNELEEDQNL